MDTFHAFPKTPRLLREVVITEKIDGSNAQIVIHDNTVDPTALPVALPWVWYNERYSIAAGSRTRWITPGKNTDNYGFAGWVRDNAEELTKLGHGRHFGEWWGQGIQRNYEVENKRFSLFNAGRWTPHNNDVVPGDWCQHYSGVIDAEGVTVSCCRVVPMIWTGIFDTTDTRNAIEILKSHGSFAAPGFKNPEGIMVYHTAAKQIFKQLIENDDKPKGALDA